MKNRKTTSDYFKKAGVDLNTYKVDPDKKYTKRNTPGLKKGSGGVDNAALAAGANGSGAVAPGPGGAAESAMPLIAQIVEQIEDITDTPEGQEAVQNPPTEGGEGAVPGDSPDDIGAQQSVTRFVPGAHLIYKRQSDVDSFEELWIFRLDPKSPTAGSGIEEQIFAGTDIDPATMASEDGTQVAKVWIAGNAKYIHISGLAN